MPADEELDIELAAAESRLARLDRETEADDVGDGEDELVPGRDTLDLAHADVDGMHVETDEPDAYEIGVDDLEDVHDAGDGVAVIEAFCEAFNARDLDGLLELLADDCETPGLGNDCANFPEAVEDIWDRRPTSLLTRGELDGASVGVLWEVADDGSWWRVAPVFFDAVEDGEVGLVELSDDRGVLESVAAAPPDEDLDEGLTWSEWEEGAGA